MPTGWFHIIFLDHSPIPTTLCPQRVFFATDFGSCGFFIPPFSKSEAPSIFSYGQRATFTPDVTPDIRTCRIVKTTGEQWDSWQNVMQRVEE